MAVFCFFNFLIITFPNFLSAPPLLAFTGHKFKRGTQWTLINISLVKYINVLSVSTCVCMCVCKREGEKERKCVSICACMREREIEGKREIV